MRKRVAVLWVWVGLGLLIDREEIKRVAITDRGIINLAGARTERGFINLEAVGQETIAGVVSY